MAEENEQISPLLDSKWAKLWLIKKLQVFYKGKSGNVRYIPLSTFYLFAIRDCDTQNMDSRNSVFMSIIR